MPPPKQPHRSKMVIVEKPDLKIPQSGTEIQSLKSILLLTSVDLAGLAIIQLAPNKVEPPDPPEVDFETALSKSGFGRFHTFVIFASVMCCISSMVQTTAMSIVIIF